MTRRLAVGVAWLVLTAAPLLAQMENATIVGTVSDQSKAAVPAATVVIKSNDTGVIVTFTTDTSGRYASSPLRPGSYTVSATKDGFQPAVQTVRLDVNQHARIDIELLVGRLAESAVVTAEAPLVETQSAALGNVRTTREVNDLPLNGRNFVQLFHIATGVVPVGGGPTLGPSASNQMGVMGGSVNGGRASNNDFRFDGIQSQDTDQNVLVLIPSPDAIQEFKVQTSVMDASFGRNGGATVNLVIKSGSNVVQGSLFEFVRNSALDAKNFFDSPTDPIPPFRLNQFGGSIGGPLRRDRTFFFGDYQGTRIRQAQTFVSTVPIDAFRRGDFSSLPLRIFDPATTRPDPRVPGRMLRDPFPGNIIPQDRWSATGKALVDLYPLPNRPGIVNNFLFNPVRTSNTDQFDVRIDQRVGDAGSVFGRYSLSNLNGFNPSFLPAPALGAGPSFPGYNNTRGQQLVLGYMRPLSTRLVYEARFGFSRLYLTNRGELADTNLATTVGIPGINVDPAFGGLGPISVSGFRGLGEAGFTPLLKVTNNFQYSHNLSYARGHHFYKFGYELSRRQMNQASAANPEGTFSFNGQFTQNPASAAGTGSGLVDLLLGLFSSSRLDIEPLFRHRRWEHAWFVNDDIRLTPKVTANVGLRYEITTPLTEVDDQMASLVPELRQVFRVNTPELPGHTVTSPNYHNFAPRVGLAYSIDERTAIRGGYGVFYSYPGIASGRLPSKSPPVAGNVVFNNNTLATDLRTVTPLNQGFPLARPTVFDPTGRDFKYSPRDDPDTYVQQWNLNVQREVGLETVVTVAYVGSRGLHLNVFPNVNQPIPGPGPIAARRPYPNLANADGVHKAAESKYHSLQVTIEKRLSAGVSFLSAYTYAHAMDNASQDTGGGPQNARDLGAEWGNADFDIRQRWVLSWSYELPFGRGRRYLGDLTGTRQHLVGGWQINGVGTFMTGPYFTPSSAQNTLGAGVGGQRPNQICDGNLPSSERTLLQWFDLSCFQTPPAFTFGQAARNGLEGPGTKMIDLSVFKDLPVSGDRRRLQLRGEIFNLFNWPQFNIPNASIGDPGAGRISSAGRAIFLPANIAADPARRQVLLLKLRRNGYALETRSNQLLSWNRISSQPLTASATAWIYPLREVLRCR